MSEAVEYRPPRFEPPDDLRRNVAAALGARLAAGTLPHFVRPGETRVPKVTILADLALVALASDRRHSPASLRSLRQPASWLNPARMEWDDESPAPQPIFFAFSALQETGRYRYASAAGTDFSSSLLVAAKKSQRRKARRKGEFDQVAVCVPSLYLLAFWQRFEDPAEDSVDVWRGPREIVRRSASLSLGEFCDALDRLRTLE